MSPATEYTANLIDHNFRNQQVPLLYLEGSYVKYSPFVVSLYWNLYIKDGLCLLDFNELFFPWKTNFVHENIFPWKNGDIYIFNVSICFSDEPYTSELIALLRKIRSSFYRVIPDLGIGLSEYVNNNSMTRLRTKGVLPFDSRDNFTPITKGNCDNWLWILLYYAVDNYYTSVNSLKTSVDHFRRDESCLKKYLLHPYFHLNLLDNSFVLFIFIL